MDSGTYVVLRKAMNGEYVARPVTKVDTTGKYTMLTKCINGDVVSVADGAINNDDQLWFLSWRFKKEEVWYNTPPVFRSEYCEIWSTNETEDDATTSITAPYDMNIRVTGKVDDIMQLYVNGVEKAYSYIGTFDEYVYGINEGDTIRILCSTDRYTNWYLRNGMMYTQRQY